MNRFQKAYYWAFILSLLICWSPINALAYLTPVFSLVWFLLVTRSRIVFTRLVTICFLYLGFIALHVPFISGFAFHSALLSFLTYSTFIFLMAIPVQTLSSHKLMGKILTVARLVVAIEALWGLIQGAYGYIQAGTFDLATGDHIEGTIHPSLIGEKSFSNPMFAVNIALLLLLLLPSLVLEKKGKLIFIIGSLALILASVIHVLLLLAVALVLTILIYSPFFFTRKMGCAFIIGFLLLSTIAFFALRTNFSILEGFVKQLLRGDSFRSQVIINVFTDMSSEYPLMHLCGIGPGQFSSRAGLIGTGLYFGGPLNPQPLPLLMPRGMSGPFRDYVLDIWLAMARTGFSYGSTHKPYLSWLSVYVEMGGLIFSMICIYVGMILWQMKIQARSYTQRIQAISFGSGVLLLFLLGVQENYWEIPQAIFVGAMVLKASYASYFYIERENNA